jgi:hypothetical protein
VNNTLVERQNDIIGNTASSTKLTANLISIGRRVPDNHGWLAQAKSLLSYDGIKRSGDDYAIDVLQ